MTVGMEYTELQRYMHTSSLLELQQTIIVI